MAAAKEQSAKIFDITPPSAPNPVAVTATMPINVAPESPISRQMAGNPSEREDAGSHHNHDEPVSLSVTRESDDANLSDTDETQNQPETIAPQSHPAFTITEPNHKTAELDSTDLTDTLEIKKPLEPSEIPSIDALPETPPEPIEQNATDQNPSTTEPDANQSAEVVSDNSNQSEDSDSATPDRFAVTDALPDPMQKTTTSAQSNMQNPKIFDTKEYIVPIGDTHHKHGFLRASIIFGVIFAAALVGGGLLFVAKYSN